jgi:hypothetical protein
MDETASNFGMDASGNFVGDQSDVLHFPPICEYGTGNDADEEELAESIGSEDYTTHEEAEIRGSVPTTDRERNRSAYIKGQESKNAPLLGLGILAFIFMS